MSLTHLFGDYWFVDADDADDDDGERELGSLVVECPDGDALFPPHSGRYTILEACADEADALDAARLWAAQA